MQRKVERLLSREDFRRAFGGDIGDIVFPPRSLEFYTAALERIVDIEPAARARRSRSCSTTRSARRRSSCRAVLAKLGAEVLAVNPFASTASATSTAEVRDAQVARIAELVRASGSDLGFVIDPDGELGDVVDDAGHVARARRSAARARGARSAERRPGARVALPVSVTQEAERIVDERGRGDRVDEARRRRASWRSRPASDVDVRGVARRRVHLARLPARVRRRWPRW